MSILIMNEVWQNAPADKGDLLILLALADWADDRGRCFPAIATLAAKGRMSERNAQRCLTNLRDRGIVRIDIGSGPKGCNVYHIDIAAMQKEASEKASGDDKMSPLNGENGGDILSGGGDVGVTGGVTFLTEGGDVGVTQTIIEPPIEPSLSREARDFQEAGNIAAQNSRQTVPGTAEFKIRVTRFCNGKGFTAGPWPNWDTCTPDYVQRQMAQLSEPERVEAERWRDAYLLDIRLRNVSPVSVGNFLRDKLWTGLDPKIFDQLGGQNAEARKPQLQNPFSRPWMALWLGEFAKPMATTWPTLTAFQQLQMRDPAKAREIERDRRRKYGWPKAASMAAEPKPAVVSPQFVALGEAFQKVHRDSVEAAAWKAFFDLNGWPWLSTNFEWLYLPPGDPEAAMGEVVKLVNEGKGDDDAA